MLARPHARGKRACADTSGSAMEHRAMRVVAAAIVPALHATLKTLALADTTHVHILAHFESIDQNAVASLRFVLRIVEPDFTEIPHRCNTCLFEVPGKSLGDPLWLNKFNQAQLHCIVAVLVFRAALYDDARARLQHSAQHYRAVVRKDQRHSQLESEYAVNRHFASSSFRSVLTPERLDLHIH